VEHDLGSWQTLVKNERVVDIGNVKGYTGECNIHRISSRAAALNVTSQFAVSQRSSFGRPPTYYCR
jgi:hypothetical protein